MCLALLAVCWQIEATMFLCAMATSSGKDHLYASYLHHRNFKKPHDKTVEYWKNVRTNTFMDAAAEMEGVEPALFLLQDTRRSSFKVMIQIGASPTGSTWANKHNTPSIQ